MGCTPDRVGHCRRVLRLGTSFVSNHGAVSPSLSTDRCNLCDLYFQPLSVSNDSRFKSHDLTYTYCRNYTNRREQRQMYVRPLSPSADLTTIRTPRIRILYMPPVYAVVSFFSYRYFRSYTYYSLAETGAFNPTSPAALWTHPRVPCSVRGA